MPQLIVGEDFILFLFFVVGLFVDVCFEVCVVLLVLFQFGWGKGKIICCSENNLSYFGVVYKFWVWQGSLALIIWLGIVYIFIYFKYFVLIYFFCSYCSCMYLSHWVLVYMYIWICINVWWHVSPIVIYVLAYEVPKRWGLTVP